MRRTREWWARLTKAERSMLVRLERIESRGSVGAGSSYLPDDCSECGNCSVPHMGHGLCPGCFHRLESLIAKADGRFQIDIVEWYR